MNTKFKRYFLTWVACGGCFLPLLAHGDQALSQQAKSLAIMDRVLQYCGTVDPGAAGKLRQKIQDLTKGLTQQQVADLRQTQEYQAAYASMEEFVGQVDEHNAKKVCSESLSQKD